MAENQQKYWKNRKDILFDTKKRRDWKYNDHTSGNKRYRGEAFKKYSGKGSIAT